MANCKYNHTGFVNLKVTIFETMDSLVFSNYEEEKNLNMAEGA